MNLKINAAFLLVGCALGFFVANKLKSNAPDTPPAVAKAFGMAKAQKVTKANGDVVETLECGAQAELKPMPAAKKNYSVGLVGLKSVEALSMDARLGSLPVFVGAQINKNLNESKLSIRMEF